MRRRAGLTYVEVVVSLAILATAAAASLQALGSFALGNRLWVEKSTAMELANQLMAEINLLPFADPVSSTGLGIDAGEVATSRTTFDDIDDFNGWTEPQIRDRTGAPVSGYSGYSRQVTVELETTAAAQVQPALSNSVLKRITVVVCKDGKELAKLVVIRGAHHANG